MDVRMRVIKGIESGASCREAAEWLEVSPSSAVKWHQRWRAMGSVAPKPSRGSVSPLEKHADWFFALIDGEPDLTLDEIVVRMRKDRIPGGRTAVHRFFERHKVTVKKKPARGRTRSSRRGKVTATLQTTATNA